MKSTANELPSPSCAENATRYAELTRQGFERKSSHNKSEALWCFYVVIGATAAATLFITLGDGFWLGKVIPASLSASATVATAWLHRRRPQQLWALYRRCQRRIEDQQVKHRFALGEFASALNRDALLAERVAAIALDAHDTWEGLVPTPDSPHEGVRRLSAMPENG